MLILLLRVVFVTLATLVGLSSGQHIYRNVFDGALSPWFGGAMGFSVSITLIAAENAFRRHFTRSLVAFLVGLGAGLALSWLLLAVLHQVIQDENIYNNIDLPMALVTTYLVLVIVLRNADRFRVVVPFVEFRAERLGGGTVVVDAATLADSRLVVLVQTGLLPHRLLVHRRLLMHCEALAAHDDAAQAARGRRALEGLAALRGNPGLRVEIDDSEIPGATTLAEVLIHLARLENARLLAGDAETTSRAAAEDVPFIDLQALAAAFSPIMRPGEVLEVRIDKPGEGRNQGVGYLDDGSMVIVGDGAGRVGQRVRCTVLRLHNTANGRMVFAELVKDATTAPPAAKPAGAAQ
jgi:uncharacterized protein YacL